jgi:hypothetical protein
MRSKPHVARRANEHLRFLPHSRFPSRGDRHTHGLLDLVLHHGLPFEFLWSVSLACFRPRRRPAGSKPPAIPSDCQLSWFRRFASKSIALMVGCLGSVSSISRRTKQTPRGAKPFRGIHDIPRQRRRATTAAEIGRRRVIVKNALFSYEFLAVAYVGVFLFGCGVVGHVLN